MITELPEIPIRGRLSSAEILMGSQIPAIDRLQQMSEDDFEVLCLEWATGYLKSQYVKVRQLGGAGDKGRDIIAETATKEIDVYQCKHYDAGLTPTDIYVELAKICFYTQRGDFAIPRAYYFVTSIGIGAKLQGFLEKPDTINQELIDNWEKYCQNKIQSTPVLLEGKLLDYVKAFDFSILKDKAPLELIEEHSKTTYHAARFGGGLKKYRRDIPKADAVIQARELNYVTQLLKVYSTYHGREILDRDTLKGVDITHASNFDQHRNSFYAAESLELFSRENFPDADPLPFVELKDDAKAIAANTLLLNDRENSLKKVLLVIQEVMRQSFGSNPLHIEIKPIDKQGVCHHLANDNEISWI